MSIKTKGRVPLVAAAVLGAVIAIGGCSSGGPGASDNYAADLLDGWGCRDANQLGANATCMQDAVESSLTSKTAGENRGVWSDPYTYDDELNNMVALACGRELYAGYKWVIANAGSDAWFLLTGDPAIAEAAMSAGGVDLMNTPDLRAALCS